MYNTVLRCYTLLCAKSKKLANSSLRNRRHRTN